MLLYPFFTGNQYTTVFDVSITDSFGVFAKSQFSILSFLNIKNNAVQSVNAIIKNRIFLIVI